MGEYEQASDTIRTTTLGTTVNAIALPLGTEANGFFCIIDSITWIVTSAGPSTITLMDGNSGATIWSARAAVDGSYHFSFPTGMPVLVSTGGHSKNIPALPMFRGDTTPLQTLVVTYHFRRLNA